MASSLSRAYIVGGVRTAIGKFGGSLASVRADDLLAHTMAELLKLFPSVEPAAITDVVIGCANQAGEDNRNVARMSLLLAGLPPSVPGVTVNRLCASGMTAVVDAARAIRVGDGDLYLAGGVEQMTRGPFVLGKAEHPYSRTQEMYDTSLGWRFINPKMRERYGVDSMGETAENVASQYKISREDQDRFALRSQQKAAAARARGRFKQEITPFPLRIGKDERLFLEDEFIRPETNLDALKALRPAFRKEGGSVTAGNAAGLNDGACVLLLASENALKKFGLTPRAELVASSEVGVEPRIMGIGPVAATKKVLDRAHLKLSDIQLLELNEAFAAQSLACLRELGLADDDARVNPNGGAIALGHPLGMSGARLLLTSMIELEEKRLNFALSTMCVGVGQGVATIIKRVA